MHRHPLGIVAVQPARNGGPVSELQNEVLEAAALQRLIAVLELNPNNNI
jgi:hypothetical protein